MNNLPARFLFCVAMIMLTVVSIYTTYASLTDSILPEPKMGIPLANGVIWQCSVMAFGLALAIGLMLFALKLSIIGGHKRLNILGVMGMTIVAFISIAFNVDVLYRTADREFYIRYSNDKMRNAYEEFLAKAQGVLQERKTELLRGVAKQEGELDAEVKGLRKAPSGYGQYAKEENYKLTVLQKTTEVDLQAIDEAMETKKKADELLRNAVPQSLEDIDKTQAELRVIVKDMAGISGVPMPGLVKTENPLFAVFEKLFSFKGVGFKEIFIVITAFLLDLGDIIGYSLVPNRKREKPENLRIDPVPSPRLALVPPDEEYTVRPVQMAAMGGGMAEPTTDPDELDPDERPAGSNTMSYAAHAHRRRIRSRFGRH